MSEILKGIASIFDGMITTISLGTCSGSTARHGLPDYYDLPPKEADRIAMMMDAKAIQGDWDKAIQIYTQTTDHRQDGVAND